MRAVCCGVRQTFGPADNGRDHVSEAYDQLTETEKRIATEWGNGLDMMARLMTGPVSSEYFHGKFPAALRSFLKVAEMAGIDPNEPGITHVREDAPDWDVHKV